MKLLTITTVMTLTIATAAFSVNDEVTVKDVHLCCGSCVDGVDEALMEVDGVSNIASDQNTKSIAFKVSNDEAAKKAIEALARGGFFGVAKQGNKSLTFPDAGARKDAKSARIKFSGVHLCCRSCVKSAHLALKDVKGVSSIDIDREEGTVTVSGTDILHTEAVAALNKGGFYGRIAE